jgi:hypothetical protein
MAFHGDRWQTKTVPGHLRREAATERRNRERREKREIPSFFVPFAFFAVE